jgi:hypothetical protein
VTGRLDKPIPLEPLRIGWIMLEKSGLQQLGHRGGAKLQARAATVDFLHGVERHEMDWID